MTEEGLAVVGYNLLIKPEIKPDVVTNEKGIILASDKGQHQLMSGIILEIGSLALKEDPEVVKGYRVYFYDKQLQRMRIQGKEYGVITTNDIKIVEKV